jgi:hypothetical protein
MAADAAAEETLRLFEQDFQDDTWLVYLAALWQLHDIVKDDYRWPEVSRAPLLLSIYYRATNIESDIDPWQTGIPIDSDLLQYVGDTLGTHYAGDLLAFKDNWTFWADQEIKMLADSDEFDSALQSTALPDIIAGEANDTVETQRSPPPRIPDPRLSFASGGV